MYCNKCGKIIPENSSTCNNCQNNNQSQLINTNQQKQQLNKGQKITIISLLVVIVLFLSIILLSNGMTSNTRTIMIYVVGSNLETDGEIVSADINAINPSMIDLSKTNILLYTGGTKEWHNFVSNKDNGIYILKSNGFEKIESQQQYSLGAPETLTNFLKYAYTNYKTDKYDLILYDHGGAIDGAIYDDIADDNLSLEDMTTALKNSPFNEKNKLEAVLFRTCLNGTIELANIYSPYANYLIGSEEVSWGSKYTDVLSFLNNVTNNDNGYIFGEKFVKSYEEQMAIIDSYNTIKHTYSIIDLSKIDKVNEALNEYITGIDLSKNYNDIVKIRTMAYQYGNDASDYDMIDLYEFVSKSGQFSTKNNSKLLKAIDEAIIYNRTNEKESHGLSIYFPYNGRKAMKYKFLEVYQKLNYSNEYKKFINNFNNMRSNAKSFSFSFSDSSIKTKTENNTTEIQLTKEQINNYAFSTFTIFERDSEHQNYYKPIYNTDNTILDENGVLKVNYSNNLTKIKDDESGEYRYALTYYRKKQDIKYTYGILYDKDADFTNSNFSARATLYLKENEKGKLILSNAKLNSKNERIDGILINLDEYETYEIWTNSYRILDENGKVLDTTEWESAPVVTGFGGNLSELELEYSSLDKGDNYYALFIVTDMNGNASYSKLIKVGE